MDKPLPPPPLLVDMSTKKRTFFAASLSLFGEMFIQIWEVKKAVLIYKKKYRGLGWVNLSIMYIWDLNPSPFKIHNFL